MKRFVGLDGIKGLALIAIVLYHCMQQRLPGGFYGVDVFFTVSGFLIAVSLIRSLAKTGSLISCDIFPSVQYVSIRRCFC